MFYLRKLILPAIFWGYFLSSNSRFLIWEWRLSVFVQKVNLTIWCRLTIVQGQTRGQAVKINESREKRVTCEGSRETIPYICTKSHKLHHNYQHIFYPLLKFILAKYYFNVYSWTLQSNFELRIKSKQILNASKEFIRVTSNR